MIIDVSVPGALASTEAVAAAVLSSTTAPAVVATSAEAVAAAAEAITVRTVLWYKLHDHTVPRSSINF